MSLTYCLIVCLFEYMYGLQQQHGPNRRLSQKIFIFDTKMFMCVFTGIMFNDTRALKVSEKEVTK